MDAAERIGREADCRACPFSLLSIDQFDPSLLLNQRTVILVVSTTGQGDTPDLMKVFWRYLLQRHLPQDWLSGVCYAVFGLGRLGIPEIQFNTSRDLLIIGGAIVLLSPLFVAKKLCKRLSDLGGTPIIERGLGDDQHPSGYEGSLDPWMSSLWNSLNRINPQLFPNGVDSVSGLKLMDQCKAVVTYHVNNGETSPYSAKSDLKSRTLQIESARLMSPARFPTDKSRPHSWLKMVFPTQL